MVAKWEGGATGEGLLTLSLSRISALGCVDFRRVGSETSNGVLGNDNVTYEVYPPYHRA